MHTEWRVDQSAMNIYSIFYLPVVVVQVATGRSLDASSSEVPVQTTLLILLKMLVRMRSRCFFGKKLENTVCIPKQLPASCICCAQGFEFLIQQFEAVKNAAAYISPSAVLAWFGRRHWQVPIASLDQDSAVCTQLASSAWAFCPDHVVCKRQHIGILLAVATLQATPVQFQRSICQLHGTGAYVVHYMYTVCACKLPLTRTTDLVYKLDFGDWSDTVSKRKKKRGRGRCMHGIIEFYSFLFYQTRRITMV